ncbi:unnamed protein product [Vitrella brassicaformis CCMP3155]|uniref:Uncharacterized protein n=3 Tax=Vitrella brassicaformis TaxID=1169539 RepID=A0A0G4G7E1_VITBC|nr:unnamed protein product [Vitrella brassicaformis CCMP3155]|eukprot:CEM24541.1 unnamed protein product [Vitrella brassicaformis CCMP3155]
MPSSAMSGDHSGFHDLVGLPEDVAAELKTFLPAASCGTLRATSKSIGCEFISEDYLTDRLDGSIRERGLDSVVAVKKRHKTTLLYLKACCTATLGPLGLLDGDLWAFVAYWVVFVASWYLPMVPTALMVRWILGHMFPRGEPFTSWILFSTAVGTFAVCVCTIWLPGIALIWGVLLFAEWSGWLGKFAFIRRFKTKEGEIEKAIHGPVWSGLLVLLGYRERITGMQYLLRMMYVVEEGGSWKRCVELVHLLRKCHYLPRLPITITAHDLRQVGSSALFKSRFEAMRQLSLFSARFGRSDRSSIPSIVADHINVRSRQGFTEALEGILTPGILPADLLSDKLNESDPPITYKRNLAASFTDMCFYSIFKDIKATHLFVYRVAPHEVMTQAAHEQVMEQLNQLTVRLGSMWGGSRLVHVWTKRRECTTVVVLCGDKAIDEFAAWMRVTTFSDMHSPTGSYTCNLAIFTMEPRVAGKRSAAQRFPRTTMLVRAKVDAMREE